MDIKIFSTGGTIDKVYFEHQNRYLVGGPQVLELLKEAHLDVDFEVESLFQKESVELSEDDRRLIL